jgi:hypothetical protein
MASDTPPVPCLPALDPNRTARAERIARARLDYQYAWSCGEQPFVADLPRAQYFSPAYLARGAEITVAHAANDSDSRVG